MPFQYIRALVKRKNEKLVATNKLLEKIKTEIAPVVKISRYVKIDLQQMLQRILKEVEGITG